MIERNNSPRRVKPASYHTLTSEQIQSLLDATASRPEYRDLHDTVKLILRSGIQPKDLARLRWSDFKFGVRYMRILDERTGIAHGTIMDTETAAVLQARRDRAGDAEFFMGNAPAKAVSRVGGQFRRVASALGFPESGLQILRRTLIANRSAVAAT